MSEFALMLSNELAENQIKKFNNLDDVKNIIDNCHLYNNELNEDLEIILNIFNSEDIDLDNLSQYELDFDNTKIINYFGMYFQYVKKDYNQMKQCYEKNIQLNSNDNSMIEYGTWFEEIEKDNEQAIKYYTMSLELGNLNAYCKLGMITSTKSPSELEKYTINDISLKYFVDGIKLEEISCLICLIHSYLECEEEKKYDLVIKYTDLYFESSKNKKDASFILFNYFLSKEEYDIGLRYLEFGINLGYDICKILMAKFFLKYANNEQIAYPMLLELAHKENFHAFMTIKDDICSNELQFFFWLKKTEIDSEIRKLLIEKLETTEMVKNYHSKLDEYKDNIGECPICFNERIMMKFSCSHEICEKCYVNMNKCYYKCESPHIPQEQEKHQYIYEYIESVYEQKFEKIDL